MFGLKAYKKEKDFHHRWSLTSFTCINYYNNTFINIIICIIMIVLLKVSVPFTQGVELKKGINDDSQKVNHFRGNANYYILMKDYKHSF